MSGAAVLIDSDEVLVLFGAMRRFAVPKLMKCLPMIGDGAARSPICWIAPI
jgi:hypothetical protein